MFEMVVMLCLDGACREVLLPGREAATEAACQAQAVDVPVFPAGTVEGAPVCREVGAALPVEEVAPGIWVHSGRVEEPSAANAGDISNLAFVIGGTSVAVIDSGYTRAVGESLWRAIRARTDLPVSHVVLTHMHPDHVLGATVFAEAGAQVLGHDALARALADRQESYMESLARLLPPEVWLGTAPPVVDGTAEAIDLGGRVLRLVAQPVAHTGTDLAVIDDQTGTLIAGDLLFHRHTPALDGSLRGWQGVMAALTGEGFNRVVPGHGDASLPWPEGAAALTRYLDVLAADTKAALDAGEHMGEAVLHIADSERPHWDLFDAFNPRNATVAFTELEWE